MVVYGVALLSFCMLAGVFLGQLLGYLLGIDANVGGIGIAMLLLIFIANKKSMAIKIEVKYSFFRIATIWWFVANKPTSCGMNSD